MRYPKISCSTYGERQEILAIQRLTTAAESELTAMTLRLEDFGRRQEAVRRRLAPGP